MSIDEFSYVWTTDKDDYALVCTDLGYAIVNRERRAMLCISDETTSDAVIAKMLQEGNAVFKDINDAYRD